MQNNETGEHALAIDWYLFLINNKIALRFLSLDIINFNW